MREIDALSEKFHEIKATYDTKISKLEAELRRRPMVLDIPLVESTFTSEVELLKKLNEKDKFTEILKVEFANKYKLF